MFHSLSRTIDKSGDCTAALLTSPCDRWNENWSAAAMYTAITGPHTIVPASAVDTRGACGVLSSDSDASIISERPRITGTTALYTRRSYHCIYARTLHSALYSIVTNQPRTLPTAESIVQAIDDYTNTNLQLLNRVSKMVLPNFGNNFVFVKFSADLKKSFSAGRKTVTYSSDHTLNTLLHYLVKCKSKVQNRRK